MIIFVGSPDTGKSGHTGRTPKELAYDLARQTDEAMVQATVGKWDAHRTYGPLKDE